MQKLHSCFCKFTCRAIVPDSLGLSMTFRVGRSEGRALFALLPTIIHSVKGRRHREGNSSGALGKKLNNSNLPCWGS